jgi:hypothetical protein
MALRRNSFLAGIVIAAACFSSPVLADDSTITNRENDHRSDYLDDNYIYDYMTHRDSITVGLGDAPTSNLVIMHPTPWPYYINDTNIKTPAGIGVSALDNMMERYASGSTPTSNIDQGTTTGAGVAAGMATTSAGTN